MARTWTYKTLRRCKKSGCGRVALHKSAFCTMHDKNLNVRSNMEAKGREAKYERLMLREYLDEPVVAALTSRGGVA